MNAGATGQPGSARQTVDDLAALSQTLLDDWRARASTMAGHLDSGDLTADQATQDLADCTVFGLRCAAVAFSQLFGIATRCAGTQGTPRQSESPTFSTTELAGTRTLKLAGPLVADVGSGQIAVDRVAIEPTELKQGNGEFKLVADTTGHDAVGYSGVVQVSDAAGAVLESVDVYLMAM